jgi:hypothetical protein
MMASDDFRSVDLVDGLDALAWVRCYLALVDSEAEHAREHLLGVVVGARPIRELRQPLADQRADLRRPVELRGCEGAEVPADTVEPPAPDLPCHWREFLEITAGLVALHHCAEPRLVGDAGAVDRGVVGLHELGRAKLRVDPRAAAPRVNIGPATHLHDVQALKLYHSHAFPRTRPIPDRGHLQHWRPAR